MRYQSCDELSANLLVAEEYFKQKLQLSVAEDLIERVCKVYPNDRDFEELLNDACDKECVYDDERHAYKYALGLFFNRRAQVRKRAIREMDSIPFSPRSQQDD